jgi:hypothetical protein
MSRTFTITMTEDELDLIWSAMVEFQDFSEPEVSEQVSNVMDKLHEAVVS